MGVKKKKNTARKGPAKSRSKSKLRSMTGFGRGAVSTPFGVIIAEIKTLNHRHLSISCLPFEGFFLLEEKIKDLLEKSVSRGKVFVRISRENGKDKKSLQKIHINRDVIKEYVAGINKLKKTFPIEGDIRLQDLMAFPGVIEHNIGEREKELWPYVKKAVEKAVGDLLMFRQEEGGKLAKDFMQRLDLIRDQIRKIKRCEKRSIERYRKRLAQMIQAATSKKSVDAGKVEEEVAIFARNCDISEELLRLENHISAFKTVLKSGQTDPGKKLDFIAQEMHREANTIGAKANDFEISNAVIEIKSEIEKVREQLKNIE